MTSIISSLSNTQISALSTTTIASLKTADIAALSTKQVSALTSSQVTALSTDDIVAFTSPQISAITANAIIGLSTLQTATLETADIAALSGRHAARQIATFLEGGVLKGGVLNDGVPDGVPTAAAPPAGGPPVPGRNRIPVLVEAPLRWISPNVIGSAAAPPLGRFVLRSREFRRGARLEAWQDGRLLARSRPVRLIPERPAHFSGDWLHLVDPAGGPVRVITGS
jgi:hypothetical protein